jgi:MFS transporter, ACS family, tartrate transporter
MQELALSLPSAGVADSVERATIRRITWRFVPLLALGYIFSMIDRVNVGFAAVAANRDLHLSPSAFGLGAGIAFIGYVLFGFASNQILARVGARLWLARIMIAWGLISACTAFVVGPLSFYLVRFLLGVAEAGYFPGIVLFMSLWFPRRYRARYLAMVLIGMPLSALIGAPMSALLLSREGLLGLHGWQWLYVVEALPAVLLGVAVRVALTDRPENALWLTTAQREWLTGKLAVDPPVLAGEARFFATLVNCRVLFYGLIFFNITAASFGLVFWLPQIVHATGLSPALSNYVTAIPYAFGIAGMIAWARFSDWTGDRIRAVAVASALAGLGLAVSVMVHAPLMQLGAICAATAGIYALKGPNMALVTESFAGREAPGGIAMVSALGALSGFVPNLIVGWIREVSGGFTGGLLFLALLSFLGAAQVLFVPWFEAREQRRAASRSRLPQRMLPQQPNIVMREQLVRSSTE